MKIFNFPQRSKEWYEARAWVFTASNSMTIANKWKWIKTLCEEMMSDYYSSEVEENITTRDMQKGIMRNYFAIAYPS